jgi:hypothetical protein
MQFKLLAMSLALGATALLGACSTEADTTTDPAAQPGSPTELQSPTGSDGVTVPESPAGLDESPTDMTPDTTSPTTPDSTLESPGAVDPVDPMAPDPMDSPSPESSTLESPSGTPAN